MNAPAKPLLAPKPHRVLALLKASRPRTLGASLAPVLLGGALAESIGSFALVPWGLALAGAVALQIGANFFNDWADFKRGADTDERLGPPRAVAAGWLSAQTMRNAAIGAFAAATLIGAMLVYLAGWPVVAIGVASIIAGLAYTGGPWPLAYVGLGEPFVLFFFGVVATAGTVFVQTGHMVGLGDIRAGLCVGFVSTAILVVNNLRDRHTDAKAAKRTLAVRFGALFSRVEYVLLLVAAAAMVLWEAAESRNPYHLLPFLALPMALREARSVWQKDGAALNPHLGGTARLELFVAVLYGIGLYLGGPR